MPRQYPVCMGRTALKFRRKPFAVKICREQLAKLTVRQG